MTELVANATADIAAPIDVVFQYRLDFRNLPAYNPDVSNFRRVDEGTDLGPGAEYAFDFQPPDFEAAIVTKIRVLEVEPPHKIVITAGPDEIAAHEVFTLTQSGDATRAHIVVTLTLPGELDDATRQLFEKTHHEQAQLELDQIKKGLES